MGTDRKVEPIHFSEPRAERVRNPENLKDIHSAVYGSIAVYVDSKTEADMIIASWEQILESAAAHAQTLLDEHRSKAMN